MGCCLTIPIADPVVFCVGYKEQGLTLCEHCVKPIEKEALSYHQEVCIKVRTTQRQEAIAVQEELRSDQLVSEERKGPTRPPCGDFEMQTMPYQRPRSEAS